MSKSLGGHPTGAVPAQQAGIAPSSSVAPRAAYSAVGGGQDWVGEDPKCSSVIKANGWPCDQPPRPGHTTCFGHRHDEE